MDTDAYTSSESDKMRVQELTKKRNAFLLEVYKKTGDDPRKIIPGSEIAEALNFDADSLEKISLYLQGEGLIKDAAEGDMNIENEGPETLRIVFSHRNGISITHKGIVRAEKLVQTV